MDNPVIIFGAGGLGKAALEIFKDNGVVVYAFLDDDKSLHNTEINEISVLGSTDDDGFLKYIGKKCEAFVAVDENTIRQDLVKMLNERRKIQPVNAVHKSSMISEDAHIGHGNFINSAVVIGTQAKVGNHCILHSGAIIDFSATLEDFVQVGAGSVINTGVHVGKNAFIGSGVTIVSGVKVGVGARVGAGSVVISDVPAGETFFGNPAQKV
ncbi:acetyltransferase [Xanthovirga aplysinae]|uniref:acetyltransferase n=1 Tax=Xanthovirga aplysinae TaxID=2529853 RepID=UPI0012BCE93C|nr:acetyltransferase [Xanthovirga aplysinae]MTI31286.1 acetyltransferase [Xanthovirga aplysinae]